MSLPAGTGLSIVVASTSGETTLHECLITLDHEREGNEVVVVGAPVAARERLALRFPWATWCDAPSGSSVFTLRARGLEAARGATVVLVEDHVRVRPGWRAALQQAAGRSGVAGGPVECADTASLRAFALYLVEYSALMPREDGPGPAVLAVNAAYDRKALDEVASFWRSGFHDNEVHDALAARGHAPHTVAAALVQTTIDMSWPDALRHLFQGGRRYGSYRRSRGTTWPRAARVLAGPLVPAVLLARILGRVAARRPRWLARTILALPYLGALLLAWGGGELRGALGGEGTPAPGA